MARKIFYKKSGKKSFVLLTGKTAYKFFYGRGARDVMALELEYSRKARNCPVWGPHILPLETSHVPFALRSQRGDPLSTSALRQAARELIESLCVPALSVRPREAAHALLPFDWLLVNVSDTQRNIVESRSRELLAPLRLPAGPAHGDLHAGNILHFGGKLLVFDSRYREESSPVFDLIHHRVCEIQEGRGGSWLEVLIASGEHVAEIAAMARIERENVRRLSLAYALNRIALESRYWMLRDEIMGNREKKYTSAALRLLEYCEQAEASAPGSRT